MSTNQSVVTTSTRRLALAVGLLVAAGLSGCADDADTAEATGRPASPSAGTSASTTLLSIPEWNTQDEGAQVPLGPGTYAGAVRIDADQVIILNGFHPRQLGFFTAEDTVCAFLHGSSETDWEVLRSELIGATDPSKAASGSIRGTLRADPASFGLASVNSNFNGVHMSAGPLEGLGELDRFFGEVGELSGWSFAQALRAAGASADDVSRLVDNPVVVADGERGTAFDLTEGMNADAAAKLLAGAEA